jgi:hypothetical protein
MDVFAGYETHIGPDSNKTLYCHVTTLRQINYVRVVDAVLQVTYLCSVPAQFTP